MHAPKEPSSFQPTPFLDSKLTTLSDNLEVRSVQSFVGNDLIYHRVDQKQCGTKLPTTLVEIVVMNLKMMLIKALEQRV